MGTTSFTIAVSFAKTPLNEITQKVVEIEALGWLDEDRGDPWVVAFVKKIPEGESEKAVELVRRIMGDYWVDADEIEDLLASK